MPAEIAIIPTHQESQAYQMVPPGFAGRLRIYDADDGSRGIIAVRCDSQDRTSEIFVFEEPENYSDDKLEEYCKEEAPVTTIDSNKEYVITTHMDAQTPVKIFIGHSMLMCYN